MPSHPDPDRVDDYGFTCEEVAQLLGRSPKRVRQLCLEVPGFGVRLPDHSWRVPPIFALAALALAHDRVRGGKVGPKEFARRTQNGMNALGALAKVMRDDPVFRDRVRAMFESNPAVRAWWDNHRSKPPPDDMPAMAEREVDHAAD